MDAKTHFLKGKCHANINLHLETFRAEHTLCRLVKLTHCCGRRGREPNLINRGGNEEEGAIRLFKVSSIWKKRMGHWQQTLKMERNW